METHARTETDETTRSCPWDRPVPPFTYLAGAAGSGKTFLTKAWQQEDPGLLLCATTGIAAINLGGSTLNAILGYFDTKSLQDSYTVGMLTARLGKLWKSGVRRLIVDEVSMMDGDQLTYLVRAVEEVNGRGYVLDKYQAAEAEDQDQVGMGLTLVGDFAQLGPIKAPFAFESPEWEKFQPYVHTLTEIRRQADPDFIEALRAARVGDGAKALEYFADRILPETDDHFDGPTILAKNEAVDRFNRLRLDKIPGKTITFTSDRWGKQRSEWGNPEKHPSTWGVPHDLVLKEGALVMVLANLRREGPPPQPYFYVNGDLGIIEGEEGQTAQVRLHRTGEIVTVHKVTREVKVPCDAARRKQLRDLGQSARISDDGKWEVTGDITYMPLRLAYASTVHKAQGLSLDRVQVNLRDPFFRTPGMVYVGLSRARTAEGLRLVGTPASFLERCTTDPRLKGWL